MRRGGYARMPRKYQGGWVQLIYFVVSLIITVLLSPKPATPKPASIEDFDVPTAEQNRFIPVAFGEVEFKDPNVVWYGDLDIAKIRKSSTFGGSQTIGYRYFLSMHCVFSHGPCDAIGRFEMGEKALFGTMVTSSQTVTIYQPDVFGGERGGGGMVAKVDVMLGAEDQGVNAYMLARVGAPQPAYRGVTSVIVRGWNSGGAGTLDVKFGGRGKGAYIGNQPTVAAFSARMIRIRAGWHGTVWNPDDAAIGNGMNPAHICYQVLTDPEFASPSSSQPGTDIDEAFFHDFADRAIDEGLGLNLKWTSGTAIDFLQVVLDHAAGILGYSPSDGFLVQLIRGDYDVNALTRFDESNVREVTDFERRTWGETVNELTVVFQDGNTFKAAPMTVQDLGNIRAQQVRIPEKIDRSGIRDPDVKRVVAGRELAARSTPLARCSMTTNRIAFDKRVGECVILSWEKHNLVETVFRIVAIKKGKLGAGTITANVVEDIYALAGIEYNELPDTGPAASPPPLPPEPPDNGGSVQSATLHYPPDLTGRQDGDRYLVPSTVPGDSEWFGHEGEIAEWDADAEEWIYIDVPPGSIISDGDGGHVSVDEHGNVVASPWTPAIPPMLAYPGTLIEETDVQLVGYSLIDQKYYKFPSTKLPSGSGSNLTVTDIDTTAVAVEFIGMTDAQVVEIGAGQITIKVSPLTTKGDVYTRTSTGVARQPAGPDGTVLGYDSSQATGLRAIAFSTAKYREPVANGDPDDPQPVYVDGDFLFVQVSVIA